MTEQEILMNASFKDASIIPTVFYQVYGLKGYLHEDCEGMFYTFDPGIKSGTTLNALSTISVKLIAKTWVEIEASEDEKANATEVTELPENYSENVIYAVGEVSGYKKYSGSAWADATVEDYNAATKKGTLTEWPEETDDLDTDTVYRIYNPTYYKRGTTTTDTEEYLNYQYNKYGKPALGSEVEVTITPSTDLKAIYTNPYITIDGKDYGVGNSKTFTLSMNHDHQISIIWDPEVKEKIETFRITWNR